MAGKRFCTFLLYLNDKAIPDAGGDTMFPKCPAEPGLGIHPGKGGAGFFYNLTSPCTLLRLFRLGRSGLPTCGSGTRRKICKRSYRREAHASSDLIGTSMGETACVFCSIRNRVYWQEGAGIEACRYLAPLQAAERTTPSPTTNMPQTQTRADGGWRYPRGPLSHTYAYPPWSPKTGDRKRMALVRRPFGADTHLCPLCVGAGPALADTWGGGVISQRPQPRSPPSPLASALSPSFPIGLAAATSNNYNPHNPTAPAPDPVWQCRCQCRQPSQRLYLIDVSKTEYPK
jgi:hypothetical protein